MPVRTFDQLDVITTFNDYTFGPTGNTTPSLTDTNFGNWFINTIDSQAGITVGASYEYTKIGTVNFSAIDGIPEDALISLVVIRIPRSSAIHMGGTAGLGGISVSNLGDDGLFHLQTDFNVPYSDPALADYTFFRSNTAADTIYDYSSAPINRTVLIATHGTQTLKMTQFCFANTLGTNNVNNQLSYDGGWRIQVTYTEAPVTFKLPVITTPNPKVTPGDLITIKSLPLDIFPPIYPPDISTPPPLDLTFVDHIDIVFSCSGVPTTVTVTKNDFIIDTWYTITFLLPALSCNPPVIKIILVIAGTQFTGSVPLNDLLTIFFLNGSGIYRFITDKTNDTLYVHDETPVITTDIKVPNPFAKTAFLP